MFISFESFEGRFKNRFELINAASKRGNHLIEGAVTPIRSTHNVALIALLEIKENISFE